MEESTRISVLVCEDDPVVGMQAVQWIERYFARGSYRVHTTYTQTADECLSAYMECRPDLAVIDILLGEQSGYDIAAAIRQRRGTTEIIFITAHTELMREAFAYKPLDFLCKPFSQKAMEAVLQRFVHEREQKRRTYRIVTREYALNVRCEEIICFESRAHTVLCRCATRREPIQFTAKLDTIEGQLRDTGFVRVHKSYLVNVSHIAALDRTRSCFTLHGGETVPVSRKYYRDAVEAYMAYFFE